MIVSCTISRTLLSLSALELQDPTNGYEVDTVGPGITTWRRNTAQSPYVEGTALVSAVREQATSILTVNTSASSAATLETRTLALLAAFEQFSFTLTLTIDSVVHTWLCDTADYGPLNGVYDPFPLSVFQQVYTFSIPRQPATTSST